MHWLYEPTQIPVYQELLNPGCGVIHPFRIQLPKDGRLEIPIGVSVAMLDESPTHATLVADIPSFLAQALAREK